ncbi:MAG TPA: hypothetical protein VNZ03_25610 [Terriglobales bacterium]|nr:hypothetical protein [Terriglobales bacterium]
MKFPLKALLAFAMLATMALSFAGILPAQDQPTKIIPTYTVINYAGTDVAAYQALAAEGQAIPTWNGSFPYHGIKYPFTMIGTDPAKGSATTTVQFAHSALPCGRCGAGADRGRSILGTYWRIYLRGCHFAFVRELASNRVSLSLLLSKA